MKKIFISILTLSVLTLGIWAAMTLTQERQEIRKKAVSPGGLGKITLTPETATHYPGDVFSTAIHFQTGTNSANAATISSVTLRITYSYSGSTPELDVVDSNGNPSNQIYPDNDLILSEEWAFPIKSVTRSGGKVTIELAAVNTSVTGFKSHIPTPLATIYFKANQMPVSNPIILSFDLTETRMMTKADPPEDILDVPTNGQYTIQADTQAPAAIINLAVTDATKESLSLSWSAPTDSGPEGKADSYDLRYSTSPISEANWSAATPVAGLPTPANPGVTQTFTVSNLAADTQYYFGLKSTDAVGNTSDLSNIVDGTTDPATFTFGFRLQGVTAGSISKAIRITLKGATTKIYSDVTFISNSSGVFRPSSPIALTGFSIPGSGVPVAVLVKDASHLQKKLGDFTLTPTDNVAPSSWDSISVKAGDFDDNNVLNIVDIGNLLSVYTALSVPVSPTNQIYDVNSSNTINIEDIAIVLANYTELVVSGDE